MKNVIKEFLYRNNIDLTNQTITIGISTGVDSTVLLHSLLLLSSLFEVSLDELIKGDIELMKKEICKKDTDLHNYYSNLFSIIFLVCLVLFVPAVKYLKVFGLIICLVIRCDKHH